MKVANLPANLGLKNMPLPGGKPTQAPPDPLDQFHKTAEPEPNALATLYDPEVKDQSVDALLVSGVKDCVHTAAGAVPYLGMLAAGGGLALFTMSASRLATAKKPDEAMEALSDSHWGAQAALPMVGNAFNVGAKVVGSTCAYLGTVGGALEGAVGVHRLVQGVQSRDTEKTLIGLTKIGAGTCWALASLAVAPMITAPAFIGLAVGEKAYTNRHKLRKGWHRLEEKIGLREPAPPPRTKPPAH